MRDLGQTMVDTVLLADASEDVPEGMAVGSAIGELDAVVCEHRVQGVGHCLDHISQELRSHQCVGCRVQFGEHKLGGPIDGHEQIQLALGCLSFCNVDMKVANRIAFKPLLRGLVARDVG